ncbi:MAG: hypothetical protein OXE87_01370 [Chloroflexi bacterium]|nr:hypothetical protein [Chloroflexota bacterium]
MHNAFTPLPFQQDFVRHATDPEITIAALTLPRANGKTTLAGWLAARMMTPGDDLWYPGAENVMVAASMPQARIAFNVMRGFLGDDNAYAYTDTANRISARHKETRTAFRLIGSNGKTAMGLLNTRYAICDEPGAWEQLSGALVWTALDTARGKPDSPLTLIVVGTLAPHGVPGNWWRDLVEDGTRNDIYVKSLQGDLNRWDDLRHVYSVNPLARHYPELRKQLRIGRDEARMDPRKKADYLSYRLNIPSADESTMLLDTSDWLATLARETPDREGRPVVGVDLGGGRAWSAAVAIFPNGRTEAIAVAPGVPDLADQERRDRAPGQYQRLLDNGQLIIAHGKRVPPAEIVTNAIRAKWGRPKSVTLDRFRLADIQDADSKLRYDPRVTRWSEASADIRALRKMAKDGPLSVDSECALLVSASLSVAMVKNDDQGSFRLVKRANNNQCRDDVASALTLAAGAWDRSSKKRTSGVYLGLA